MDDFKINFILGIFLLLTAIIYIRLAKSYNIVDNPNFRSSHTVPTIRGGGILFYIAVILFFIISNFQYPYFFAGISSIALISFIDDIKTLSAKVRLPFQFFAVAMVLLEVGLFQEPFLVIGLLLMFGVAFINMYNFMDGINGITGLYSLVLLSAFYVINNFENIIEPSFIGYLIISILVFGIFNFRIKARMFAGDIGSITMAMVVLFLALFFGIHLKAPIFLLMVVVYGVDSGLTILYRVYLKENITQAHRHHMYQKLVDVFKWSHLKVAIVYAVVQLIITSIVIFLYEASLVIQYLVIGITIVLLVLSYVLLFLAIEKKKTLVQNN